MSVALGPREKPAPTVLYSWMLFPIIKSLNVHNVINVHKKNLCESVFKIVFDTSLLFSSGSVLELHSLCKQLHYSLPSHDDHHIPNIAIETLWSKSCLSPAEDKRNLIVFKN